MSTIWQKTDEFNAQIMFNNVSKTETEDSSDLALE